MWTREKQRLKRCYKIKIKTTVQYLKKRPFQIENFYVLFEFRSILIFISMEIISAERVCIISLKRKDKESK